MLYANASRPLLLETDWVDLVRATAGGDQSALHALYDRAHRPVFTLIVRITCNRETAEEVTLDVFHDVWRRASHYDPAGGTVLGWIMNQARSRAIDRLRFDSRQKRTNALEDDWRHTTVPRDSEDLIALKQRGQRLRTALLVLTPDERLALETAYFGESTYADAAAQLNVPLGTLNSNSFGSYEVAPSTGAGGVGVIWSPDNATCDCSELVSLYALDALPASDVGAFEAHLLVCEECRRGLEETRSTVDAFVDWPTDLLRPAASLKQRLARRIAPETGGDRGATRPREWREPAWDEVAPGILFQNLSDGHRARSRDDVGPSPAGRLVSATHARGR